MTVSAIYVVEPDTDEWRVLGRKLPQHAGNGSLGDLKLGTSQESDGFIISR